MPTSTINPAIPANGASLSSAAIRANFQAAVNDINALYNYFDTNPTLASITGASATLAITGFASAGAITLTGGPPATPATTAGGITVTGGAATGLSTGGPVAIAGGSVSGAFAGGSGGSLTLSGGAGGVTGTGGDLLLSAGGGGTSGKVVVSGLALRVGSTLTTANGSVATALSSVGPSGSHTTVQEWLVIQNSAGTARYIPLF